MIYLLFLYKKDFKVSLFLTLLLFSLNQNGIRNSVDYFQNGEAGAVSISPDQVDKCSLKCYQDDSISLDDCDTMCQDSCKAMCAEKLSASEISRSLIEEAGILKQFKDSTDNLDKERLENINELLNITKKYKH